MHVLEVKGVAVGYMQHYLVRDYPEYLAAVGDRDAAAVDFMIGSSSHVGIGLGPAAIKEYVERVLHLAHPNVPRVVSTPDVANHRSIRALEKAGFHQVATIVVVGKPERLLIREFATRPPPSDG